jgi:hypothetical protein
MFNLTETLGVGYDGANFSVIHSYDGAAQEQLIEITATGNGTACTITLNGVSTEATTSNSTTATNAYEIITALEADVTLSAAWNFEQVDNKVYCIAKAAEVRGGAYSISGGGITATNTTKTTGKAKTDAHVAQANWNMTTTPFASFDPTKMNIYRVKFGYLGVANITFGIYNPNTGGWVDIHQIQWANTETTTHVTMPNFKIGWTAASLGSSGTNLIVTGGSGAIFLDGDEVIKNNTFSSNNTVGSLDTTMTNLLTIKNRLVYGNYYNLGKVFPLMVTVDNEHNKALIVEIYRNPDVDGTLNYQFVDEFNSIATTEKAGTDINSGGSPVGTVIDSFIVEANGQLNVDLTALKTEILPNSRFVIAAKTVSGTSAGDTNVSCVWKEEK